MRKRIFASLILMGLLSGCAGQELTNVTLIQTLGVDGGEQVELTAVGEEDDESVVYHTQGDDVAVAQARLNELGETRLEVTHVAQLVLGRDADIKEILWQELERRKSGYGATVWLCDETLTAGELLEGAQAPVRRLKSLEENAGVRAPTILDALNTLERDGQVKLPVLALDGERLRWAGYETVGEG